jgi:hypothetical protein
VVATPAVTVVRSTPNDPYTPPVPPLALGLSQAISTPKEDPLGGTNSRSATLQYLQEEGKRMENIECRTEQRVGFSGYQRRSFRDRYAAGSAGCA